MTLLFFYTLSKHQKTCFSHFWGVIKRDHLREMAKWNFKKMSFQINFLRDGYTSFNKQLHYWVVIIIVKVITVFIGSGFAKN